MTGVDGDRHGSDGGQGHHQGMLVALWDVDVAGVVGGVELGVITAVAILKRKNTRSC